MRPSVVLLLALGAASGARAQAVRFEEGVRVRATVDGRWLAGRLVRVGAGRLAVAHGADTLALAGAERVALRVRRTRGQGAGRGALLGTGAGLVLGSAAATVGVTSCGGADGCFAPGLVALVYAVPVVAGAAAVGAGVGALAPGWRWERVEAVELGLAPVGGRAGVGRAARF